MRALVTGGTGFVGGHLTALLAGAGHEVATLGTDVRSHYVVDVRDRDAVRAAVIAARPAMVFHLAALAFVPAADADPDATDAVNCGGTVNVLDAAAQVGARTLMVSTGSVYGAVASGAMPVTEERAMQPRGAYAQSKAAAERECCDRIDRQEIVRVRPFNQTGPGQPEAYVCSDFARQLALCELGRREPRIDVGDLRVARDFLDVRDAVRGYLAAAERGRPGEVYNVCSGRATTIGEVLDTLLRHTRVSVGVNRQADRLRPGEVSRIYGTAAKLARETDWRPEIDLERTLVDLLDYWRERLGREAVAKPR